MIEEALTTRLATVANNIYISAAPEGYSTPAVVFNRFMTDTADDLAGDPDHAWMSVQIDVYDPDASAAIEMAKLIRHSFASWSDDDVLCSSLKDEAIMVDETTAISLHRVKQEYLMYAALD